MVSPAKFRTISLRIDKLDDLLGGFLAEGSFEEDFTRKAGQSTILRLPGLGSKKGWIWLLMF